MQLLKGDHMEKKLDFLISYLLSKRKDTSIIESENADDKFRLYRSHF